MKITATRRLQFCSGHRVLGHENKCAHLHGHNYVVMLTAQGPELDSIGRVVDFSVLKDRLGSWIELFWDHGMIIFTEDPVKLEWYQSELLSPMKAFFAPFNPTAENMAKFLLEVVGPETLKDTGVQLVKVELWETENCKAEALL